MFSLFTFDNVKGAPYCWDWTMYEIQTYISARRDHAKHALHAEGNSVANFDALVDQVLLRCLNEYSCYATSGHGTPHTVMIPFHRCPAVPISDVFSALGWFISYAEEPRKDIAGFQKLLVLYTRLCFRVGLLIGGNRQANADSKKKFTPRKTHILVEARFDRDGRPSLQMAMSAAQEGTPQVLTALSSSLPGQLLSKSEHQNQKVRIDPTYRDMSQKARVEAYRNHAGETGAQFLEFVDRGLEGGYSSGWYEAGNCAETLSFLSLHCQAGHTHAFGAALDIKKMGVPYRSFDEHVIETYTKPCPNCQHLFQRGQSVTQYDMATGAIDGPTPSGYLLENGARQRQQIMCSYCNKGKAATLACNGCDNQAMWCSEKCYTRDSSHTHIRRSVPLAGRATYIPAIPGRPMSNEMAQAYGYYNMASNVPTPWSGPY